MLPEPRTAAVRLSSTSQHSASTSAPELFSSSLLSSSLLLSSSSSHHHNSSSNNSNSNNNGLTSSTVRAEEPPLPPRRANRRFVEHPRTPTVPELCEGIVVRWPDGRRRVITQQEEEKVQEESDLYILQHTNPTSILSTDSSTSDSFYTSNVLLDPKHTVVVECLGCRCWLRVHRLASLVKCVHCKSVTPSIPILDRQEEELHHERQERSRS
jgi:LSD1 subclass zinc finger protein